MERRDVFRVAVETTVYKDRISTTESSSSDGLDSYGKKRLSEALYACANECALRHSMLAADRENGQAGGKR